MPIIYAYISYTFSIYTLYDVYLLYSLLDYSFPQIVNSLSIVYYTVYGILNSVLFPPPIISYHGIREYYCIWAIKKDTRLWVSFHCIT